VHLQIDYPDVERDLNQWLPLVKWLFAIPHFIVLAVLSVVAFFAVVIAWFAILFTGRYPRGAVRFRCRSRPLGAARPGVRDPFSSPTATHPSRSPEPPGDRARRSRDPPIFAPSKHQGPGRSQVQHRQSPPRPPAWTPNAPNTRIGPRMSGSGWQGPPPPRFWSPADFCGTRGPLGRAPYS